jgi:hypothetical protein
MNCWTCDDRQSPLPSRYRRSKKRSCLCCRRLDRDRVVRRQPVHGPPGLVERGFLSRLATADLPTNFPTMNTLQEIEAAALRLPDKDRLHLVDKILGSLPAPLAPAKPEEILAEAIRRDAELECGEVLPLTEGAFWAGVRRRSA